MTTPPVATAHEAAEAALLGAMLLSAEARAGAPGIVTADDFEREAHRTLFATITKMMEADEPVDPVTLNHRLVADGRLAEVGGALAVHHLSSLESCPVPASWPTYSTIVAREGRRRRGIRMLRRGIERLEAGEDPQVVATEIGVAT